MSLNVADVILDADLAESFQIVRSAGQFVAGGWNDAKKTIKAFGIVTMARARDIEMLPEGDRTLEARAFYCTQPLYVSHDNSQDGRGTSDILQWGGSSYRVLNVLEYGNRGYWKAIAVRLSGV